MILLFHRATSCTHYMLSSKSDASDVINFDEYKDLANKILKKRSTRPITVFVDMPAVEKAFAKVSNMTRLHVCYYIVLSFTPQKKGGLFLSSDDEDGDGPGGDSTDFDEVSNDLSLSLG